MPVKKNTSEFASELAFLTRKSEGFGFRIQTEREKLGLTQGELARKVGVSLTTIQNYEGGQLPRGEHAITLSFVLKISLDELLLGCPSTFIKTSQSELLPVQEHPVILTKTAEHCPRCERLETELEEERKERRELSAENRKLWKENGELKERCATLEERQKTCCPELFSKKLGNDPPNNAQICA